MCKLSAHIGLQCKLLREYRWLLWVDVQAFLSKVVPTVSNTFHKVPVDSVISEVRNS